MATFKTSDGVSLAVYDAGGDGIPFVFQHGLCGAAGQPAEVNPELPGTRFVTLECRGHGASESGDRSRFSIAQFADDVAALITQKLGGKAIVGGISMGAAIALRLAVKHPALVSGLVIARPAWISEAAPVNMRPNAEVGTLLAQYAPDDAKQQFMTSETADRLRRDAPDNMQSLEGFFERQPITITSALLTKISADGPGVTEGEIAHLNLPTLVIGHAADAIHPLAYAERLARLIPSAALNIITSKAVDKTAYVAGFKAALDQFLKEQTNA